jgi:thymidylate synthase
MNPNDQVYHDLCTRILNEGDYSQNRTGEPTVSVFGHLSTYSVLDSFPLLTTKKVNFEAVKAELFWFLSGSKNVNDLPQEFQFIWKPWAKEDGSVGPIYGSQWVNWTNSCGLNYNQIQDVIDRLKKNPTDRRLIVSAWNVDDISSMALPPCHVMFQLRAMGPFLDLMMFQRSCDVPVGVPFNVASYSLLLCMIAQEVGLKPRNFIHSLGDAHIYVNQIENMRKQLLRQPKNPPKIFIEKKPFWDLKASDVSLLEYDPHPFIKYEVAV